jgi:hypothetical protein
MKLGAGKKRGQQCQQNKLQKKAWVQKTAIVEPLAEGLVAALEIDEGKLGRLAGNTLPQLLMASHSSSKKLQKLSFIVLSALHCSRGLAGLSVFVALQNKIKSRDQP